MQYRRFGKTNLQLSVFSLGTMRYISSAKNVWETIEKALSLGINHLETARGYGKSEEYMGQAFKTGLSVPREQLYVTTKITPSPDAQTMGEHIKESLSRLNLDYLDCLAIHGINTLEHLEWIQAKDGCMQAVHAAVKDGRIKHLGFSTHGPLEVILAAINTDLFEFVNLHYYYFFQRNAAAIQLASEKNMGVFIISPADKGGRLYTPPETLRQLCNPLTPLAMNYHFLLSDRRIHTMSVGPENPAELVEPLQVADSRDELIAIETNVLENVLEKLAIHQNTVLATDKCSQCFACLPCPEKINIPEVLRLRNLAVAYDMIDYGQYRYSMFENAGHWYPGVKGSHCTECGDCLPRCPENLDIPQLLQDAHHKLQGKSGKRLWD